MRGFLCDGPFGDKSWVNPEAWVTVEVFEMGVSLEEGPLPGSNITGPAHGWDVVIHTLIGTQKFGSYLEEDQAHDAAAEVVRRLLGDEPSRHEEPHVEIDGQRFALSDWLKVRMNG